MRVVRLRYQCEATREEPWITKSLATFACGRAFEVTGSARAAAGAKSDPIQIITTKPFFIKVGSFICSFLPWFAWDRAAHCQIHKRSKSNHKPANYPCAIRNLAWNKAIVLMST
jgi:hypothetical protein